MKILAIDTATEACSVALLNEQQIIEDYCLAPQQHSKLILTMIDKLLAEQELNISMLDGLAFGRGPGSFTGLRIAASVIQGLAFAADLPVLPVSTLQAIAQGACRDYQAQAVLAAIDARMGEIYWAEYQLNSSGVMQLIGNEQVNKPDELILANNTMQQVGAGSGWITYKEPLLHYLAGKITQSYDYYPHAQDIARIAGFEESAQHFVAAEHAIPVYIRDNVVHAR